MSWCCCPATPRTPAYSLESETLVPSCRWSVWTTSQQILVIPWPNLYMTLTWETSSSTIVIPSFSHAIECEHHTSFQDRGINDIHSSRGYPIEKWDYYVWWNHHRFPVGSPKDTFRLRANEVFLSQILWSQHLKHSGWLSAMKEETNAIVSKWYFRISFRNSSYDCCQEKWAIE